MRSPRVPVGLLSAVLGCSSDGGFVLAPHPDTAFLVLQAGSEPPRSRTVELGAPLSFEVEPEERVFLVRPDWAEAERLYPAAVLDPRTGVRLRFSSATCPSGLAPSAERRAHALPSSAWTVLELRGDGWEAPAPPPMWVEELRLEFPVRAACGLPSPGLEPQPLPFNREGAYDYVMPIGGGRWVGLSLHGQALVLLQEDPPAVLDEIRTVEDLGFTEPLDQLRRLIVDERPSPMMLVVATTRGLLRYRVAADRFEEVDRSWSEHDMKDLVLTDEGVILGAGDRGLVFTATRADARPNRVVLFGGPDLERIRQIGHESAPYLLAVRRGRLLLGDPFARGDELAPLEPTRRSWFDLALWPTAQGHEVYAVDAGQALIHLNVERDLEVSTLELPPELHYCESDPPDECGFVPSTRSIPFTVVAIETPESNEPILLVGLSKCRGLVAMRPRSGCVASVLGLGPGVEHGLRFPSVTPDAIYFPTEGGSVYRWNRTP